jgi:hypothetical protein
MSDQRSRRDRRRRALPELIVLITVLSIIFIVTVAVKCGARRHEHTSIAQILPNDPPKMVGQPLPLPLQLQYEQPMLDRAESIPDAPSALLEAIDVMQSHHFALWQGIWPRAIDWTAAVLGTHVSATLRTLTSTFDRFSPPPPDALALENIINRYFLQTSAFYFGENAFGLRNQAYDDMLWVVLGWLENVKFINLHSRLHYSQNTNSDLDISASWHGSQFIPSAAHRARIFYELASNGWDTILCGGGMNWNPDLVPYKNAITNELYIAASISMYLYFPGDENTSPFYIQNSSSSCPQVLHGLDLEPAKPHNPSYLNSTIDAYNWLKNSNMTNSNGLYVDGYHIKGWRRDISNGTGKCDERNEMVYTYNQGVLLTGQRGLWIATGAKGYLLDGHALISNVMNATGWRRHDGTWQGLGRDGVMEEECDNRGTCSQNGHTFKGIFFHHLTEFCRPMSPEEESLWPAIRSAEGDAARLWHGRECSGYHAWITHNANAAYMTRNAGGDMGTWWGRKYPSPPPMSPQQMSTIPPGAVDYRNVGVPRNDSMWGPIEEPSPSDDDQSPPVLGGSEQVPVGETVEDVNDRGRGRTVETQSGGVAVLRAYLEWTIGSVR